MTQPPFSFVHLQEKLSSPEDSDQDLPPLTPVLATSSNTPFKPNSVQMRLESINQVSDLMTNKDLEKNSQPASQESDLFARQQESLVMTYMVSLLHTLPFMFRVGPPPLSLREGVIQPLDRQEIVEIS